MLEPPNGNITAIKTYNLFHRVAMDKVDKGQKGHAWQDDNSFAIEDQVAGLGDGGAIRLGEVRIVLDLTTEDCAVYGARSSLEHVPLQIIQCLPSSTVNPSTHLR